jgi:capsular polysaccharide transport system permease protein
MSVTGSEVAVVVDGRGKAAAIARALKRASRQARTPASIVSGGTGFRGRRTDRLFSLGLVASFIAIVLLPMLVLGIYWGLIASKQYETEIRFSLRAGEPGIMDALGGLTGSSGSQQTQDSEIIADYTRSRAMIDNLEQEIDVRQIFSRDGVDYFSRFKPHKPIEDFVRYWAKRVNAKYDKMSGIITLDVRAFTAEDSLLLADKILARCEKLVNDLSQRSRRDALRQAQEELQRAEAQLRNATSGMRDVRNSEGVLDATVEAEAVNKVIMTLRLELARVQQQIAAQGDSVSVDAPQVRLMNARVQTLQEQIGRYAMQIGDKNQGGESLADRKSALDLKQVEVNIAMQRYVVASMGYENARVDIETQKAYLSPFIKPMLATKATYPKRMWEWFLICGPALFAWALLTGAAFLVRDYMAK